jgi:hypothetical protein
MLRLDKEFGKYRLVAILPSTVTAYRDKRLNDVYAPTLTSDQAMPRRLHTTAQRRALRLLAGEESGWRG